MTETLPLDVVKFPRQTIVVEITPPKNRYLLFQFTMQKLRGRWSLEAIAGKSTSSGLSNMPTLPGMMITVNCDKRTITITDPLSDPKNALVLEQANAIVKGAFGADRKPYETVVRSKGVTDDVLKSVLCELASWKERGKITVRSGALPSLEECELLKGRRRINAFDSNPEAPKYKGDVDQRKPQVLQVGTQ